MGTSIGEVDAHPLTSLVIFDGGATVHINTTIPGSNPFYRSVNNYCINNKYINYILRYIYIRIILIVCINKCIYTCVYIYTNRYN